MYQGIESANLASLISRARTRIILHAAVYSPFAASPEMRNALESVLGRARSNDGFRGVHCISLDSTLLEESHDSPPAAWVSDFLAMLRPGVPREAVRREFALSDAYITRLTSEHRGDVCHYVTRTRPAAPIVIIDGTILCGHYLHSAYAAPHGCWFVQQAPVEYLLACAAACTPPTATHLRGAYRLVEECRHAMQGSLRVTDRHAGHPGHPALPSGELGHAV